jgi:hypothetical protein
MDIFWAAGIFVVLYAVYKRWSDGRSVSGGEVVYEPIKPGFPYIKKRSVLSQSEYVFRKELMEKLKSTPYQLFSKMRIIDFVDSKSREYKDVKEIWARHIDFLICDQNSGPVVAIELNGKSHLGQKVIDRDVAVSKIMAAAGIPLEVVNVGTSFEYAIDSIVGKYLK